MDKSTKYEFVRQKLDLLGYENEILPVSALSIVCNILDDLIQTTEALKNSKNQLTSLLEEKKAWDLGNEVYKCDNSKLLSEVNRLKVELLNKEKKVQIENAGENFLWDNQSQKSNLNIANHFRFKTTNSQLRGGTT